MYIIPLENPKPSLDCMICSQIDRREEKIQLGKDLVAHLFHTVVNISVVKPSSGHWVHADGGDDKNRMMFTNCSYSLSVYC